jgi:hypothetical protein
LAQRKLSKQRVTEKEMTEAVVRYLRRAAREVTVGRNRFDVVAYDKREKLFKLVECKRSSSATGIGRAFGQLVAYYAVVSALGRDFVNAVSKKMPLSFNRLMEATNGGRRIRVAFYVALTDDACQRVDLLRSVKTLLPSVGIIRVTRNGKCRNYVWERGEKDKKLAEAHPTVIRVLLPD